MTKPSPLRKVVFLFLLIWSLPSFSMTKQEAMEHLGINEVNLSAKSLKVARSRALKDHPDKVANRHTKELGSEELKRLQEKGKEITQLINAAYDVLKAELQKSGKEPTPEAEERTLTSEDEILLRTENYKAQISQMTTALYADMSRFIQLNPTIGSRIFVTLPTKNRHELAILGMAFIAEAAVSQLGLTGLATGGFITSLSFANYKLGKENDLEIRQKIENTLNDLSDFSLSSTRLTKALKAYDLFESALSLAEIRGDYSYSDRARMAILGRLIEKSPDLGAAFLYRNFQGHQIFRIQDSSVIRDYLLSRKSWEKEFEILGRAVNSTNSPNFNTLIPKQILALINESGKLSPMKKAAMRLKFSISTCRVSVSLKDGF